MFSKENIIHKLEIGESGRTIDLLEKIQKHFPHHSRAIGYLLDTLKEAHPDIEFTHLPNAQSLLRFCQDKRSFFQRLYDQLPERYRRYLDRIHANTLRPEDIKAEVDQATFVIIHPKKHGKRFVSLAHHIFTVYRNDRYGPGWAEPLYNVFTDKVSGFEIRFEITSDYDPNSVINRNTYGIVGTNTVHQLFLKSSAVDFTIGQDRDIHPYTYIPIKITKWHLYDVVEAEWGRGWQIFGLSGGINLQELPLLSQYP